MAENTETQLALFAADSPASRILKPGSEEAATMTEHSGRRCFESYARYSQLGSLARTLMGFGPWDSTIAFLTWRVRVTPRNALIFRLAEWVPTTFAIDSGLLPTPTKEPYGTSQNGHRPDGSTFAGAGMPSLATAAKQGLIGTPTATMTRRSEEFGKGRTPNPAEMAQGFVPTATVGDSWTPSTPESAEREWNKRNLRGIAAFIPTATTGDSQAAGSRNTEESEAHEGLSLTDWARGDGGAGRMLPTPNVPNGGRTVHHAVKIGNSYYHKGKKVQVGLDAEVRMMMPTPTSRDHKDGSAESCKNVPVNALLGRAVHQTMWNTPRASMAHGPSEAEIEAGNPNSRIETQAAVLYPTPDLGAAKGRGMKSAESRSRLGGTLNPRFVEELLGYPSGWTDLEL